MRRVGWTLFLCCLTACGRPEPLDVFAFIEGYRISHYLAVAEQLQKLDVPAREAKLRELAQDRKRASEVYPLCRMMFEAKEKQEFRRPMIGGAFFPGNTTYADWPLEPITIYQGLPILVVKGYILGGHPEAPLSYVDYCLKSCTWRKATDAPTDQAGRRKLLAVFLGANPAVAGDADWLRPQFE